jgi:hypothetical protein
MFIGLSLCINAFSKNDLVYLGLPIIIVFGIYFYIRDYKLKKEGFGVFKDARKGASNAWNKTKSGATNTWDKTKDGVGQATNYVKEQAVKQYKEAREKTMKVVNDSIEQSKKTMSNATKKFNEIKNMIEDAANNVNDEAEEVDFSYEQTDFDEPDDISIPVDMKSIEEPPPPVEATLEQVKNGATKLDGKTNGLDSL